MRFAYADPPYLGLCHLYDHSHGDDGRCWDEPETHARLIRRLADEFPDGWALSLHTPSAEEMLHICRSVLGANQVRLAAWVKPFASFKPGVNPAYAWELVIFRGGRKRGRDERTVRDWVDCNITLRRGFTGAKPEGFCIWLLDLLGVRPEDEIVDLFTGSGAVRRAWDAYRGRPVEGAPPNLFDSEAA